MAFTQHTGIIAAFVIGIILGAFLISTPAGTTAVQLPPQAIIEPAAPHDRIAEEQIAVYQSRIVLDIPNATWARFTDTKSMEPVLYAGANAIEVVPQSPDDVHVGDIVSYSLNGISYIHRVIETGEDSDGWYAVMKGDNNQEADPFKVRFDQVQRIVVAIIY